MDLGFEPFQESLSEMLLTEIMKTLHMDSTEANSMALSMLTRQLIMARSMFSEEVQGAA